MRVFFLWLLFRTAAMLGSDFPDHLPETVWRHDYLMKTPAATPSLQDLLRPRIASGGPLGFAGFMAEALYHPQHGYYSRDTRQVGRAGDFFTSVSVGPVFGHLLARRFLSHWLDSGRPQRWRIIECGAHIGTLAGDVLGSLQSLDVTAFNALEYVIAEPLESMRAVQSENLREFAGRVAILADPAPLAADPLPGIAYGNEVLDALPCHLLVRRNGRWLERAVGWGSKGFEWVEMEIRDPALMAASDALGVEFPEAYQTEVRTNYHSFIEPMSRALSAGRMMWIDYGFERPDYYHPSRDAGTLRTFSRHRASDDPLATPGRQDITAHVDFTAVADAGHKLGWQPLPLRTQGAWLTDVARDWLLEMEGRPQPDLLRQFQTLIHPAHLGRSFHVLEMVHPALQDPPDRFQNTTA
jgi:SAM-dependent MidA family methyltransferase